MLKDSHDGSVSYGRHTKELCKALKTIAAFCGLNHPTNAYFDSH